MKLTLTILVFLICLSCSESAEKNSVPSNYELLQGDWTTEKHPREYFGVNQFSFNVNDSMFTMFSTYSDSSKFKIQGNLLTVLDSSDTYYMGTRQKYEIVELTDTDLTLVAKSNNVKKRLKSYDWNSDTLKFKKITKKNDLVPTKIRFSSSGCFGSCPRLKLTVDDSRTIKFYGLGFTSIEGPYSGEISEREYDLILKQINQIDLDSLKTGYSASWTDDQTRSVTIETSDSTIKTYAYGTYLEPVELTILLDNLIDLYKRSDLKPDDSFHRDSSMRNYFKEFDPY